METRRAYLLAYLLALVVAVVTSFKIFALGMILIVIFRWALNFWYATILNLPLKTKLLVTLFTSAGFFYLMGYDTALISAWNLVKKSVVLYRTHFWPVFLYILVTGAIVFAISNFVSVSILFYQLNVIVFGTLVIILVLLGLLLFLSSIWLSVGMLYLINSYLENRREHLATIFSATKKFVLRLVGLEALRGLIVGLPFVIFMFIFAFSLPKLLVAWQTNSLSSFKVYVIILGILLAYSLWHLYYFSLKFYFASLELILSEQKIVTSLKSSFDLTKNKWWALNWRVIVVVFFYLLYAYFVNFILTEVQFFLPFIPDILTIILAFLANALVTPVLVISIVVLYREIKG